MCVKRRTRSDKATSYEQSARVEPKPKPEDLEEANSIKLRDRSVEPESTYGIVEEAVAITTFNSEIIDIVLGHTLYYVMLFQIRILKRL